MAKQPRQCPGLDAPEKIAAIGDHLESPATSGIQFACFAEPIRPHPCRLSRKTMTTTCIGDSHLERDFDILLQHNERLMQENESLRVELRRLSAGGVPIRSVERSLAPAHGTADPALAYISVGDDMDDSPCG
ncbi:hypothetical protein ABQJ54_14205 [Rhodanobacter sp. Si-c]|uniref:Uncharacterized protein n=1 Tax=Rhodanobacter lycopersici TaxID=3162487 RepID=A0ABV3QHH6_9GAMM